MICGALLRFTGGFMKLTRNAKAIIYTLHHGGPAWLGSICEAIDQTVEATDFILEQLCQHGLVKLSNPGHYQATSKGIQHLNN